LIPSVIGLTGDDPHIDTLITLRCATIALPVTAADRQQVLAVSVLVCERVLAQLDGRQADSLSPESARVLGSSPGAAQWAARFTSSVHLPLVAFRRQAAPAGVHCAVESVAHALIPDPDVILRRMLVESIEICAAWTGGETSGLGIDDRRLGRRVPAHRSGQRSQLTRWRTRIGISWRLVLPHRDGERRAAHSSSALGGVC
jgi:hypothetical protein